MTLESPDINSRKDPLPEKIEINGKDFEVWDLVPEKPKGLPVIFQPGWGGTPDMHRKNLEQFANLGRRAIAIDAPHGIDTSEKSDEIPDTIMKKVAGIMETLDAKKIEKADAVGYSQGGMDVVFAAKLYPERFRNLVLIDPGGMIGTDNTLRLINSFNINTGKQIIDSLRKSVFSNFKKAALETIKSVAEKPIESLNEVRNNAATQIHETLKELKEKHGINISIIHGVDDDVFPMERVQEIIDTDMIDGFYSVKGTHGQIYLEPEKYTALAEEALSALEKKNQK